MVWLSRGCSLVGVLAVALGSGCGLDLASDEADADTDSGTETGAGANDGGTDDGPEGDTAGDETGAATGEDPGTGGSDTDTGGDEDTGSAAACDELFCSGAGYCELGDQGPECICDEGFASTGLDCIPCEPLADTVLPAAVPTAAVDFKFLVNGESPPTSLYETGKLFLRNRVSGDTVPLGSTRHGGAERLVVPGVYDVVYEHSEGGELPQNHHAVLKQLELTAGSSSLDIDIESTTLRGSLGFLAEDEPENGLYDNGRVWLVNSNSGDRVYLGNTRDGSYAVNVAPGTYGIHYEYRESQGTAPLNRNGWFDTVTVHGGGSTYDIAVSAVHVSGPITFDGVPQDSLYDNGDLELRDPVTGDRFPLAGTEDTSYTASLLPGTYEVIYTSREVGAASPVNKDSVVQTLTVSADDDNLAINIETAVVSGSLRLNGEAPPAHEYDDGIVYLRGLDGELIPLGNTAAETFSQRVIRGTYEVVYAQDTAGEHMPVNTHARLTFLDIKEDDTHDINIPVTEVVGSLTLGGVAAPDSPYDDGRLFLKNRETGDSVALGNTREGTYAARVVPGTYDVVYANELSNELLPVNADAVLQSGVEISGDGGTLDIDVPVATLMGTMEIEGSSPNDSEGTGNLFLRDVESGDEVFIGHTRGAEFSRPLTSGTYIMEYRGVPNPGQSLGTSLPANEKAAFACYEIVAE